MPHIGRSVLESYNEVHVLPCDVYVVTSHSDNPVTRALFKVSLRVNSATSFVTTLCSTCGSEMTPKCDVFFILVGVEHEQVLLQMVLFVLLFLQNNFFFLLPCFDFPRIIVKVCMSLVCNNKYYCRGMPVFNLYFVNGKLGVQYIRLRMCTERHKVHITENAIF